MALSDVPEFLARVRVTAAVAPTGAGQPVAPTGAGAGKNQRGPGLTNSTFPKLCGKLAYMNTLIHKYRNADFIIPIESETIGTHIHAHVDIDSMTKTNMHSETFYNSVAILVHVGWCKSWSVSAITTACSCVVDRRYLESNLE